MILMTTDGGPGLPRSLARARSSRKDWLGPVPPGGRRFRAEGAEPGLAPGIGVHDRRVRVWRLRGGGAGPSGSCLEGGWSRLDLQVFMDGFKADDPCVPCVLFRGPLIMRAIERLRAAFRPEGEAARIAVARPAR